MKPQITLALQYYRLLLVYNIAFTILGILLARMSVGYFNAEVFLLGKIIGFAGALTLYDFSSKSTYFYFYNAGYRIRKTATIAFAIDIVACVLLITLSQLIMLCRHLF